jgi:predicted DCC family thiol-disulfide oxidoreductase YuxK
MENKQFWYVIFDGECGYCNRMIVHFAKNDSREKFLFVSDQSNIGKDLIKKWKIEGLSSQTIILLKENHYITRAHAIFGIIEHIPKLLPYLLIKKLFPMAILNWVYGIVSKRRHLLAKRSCSIPKESIRKKIVLK